MISRIRAQNIASDWYDGDGSGLYKIACGRFDLLTTEDYSQAAKEVDKERHADGLTYAERYTLGELHKFLIYKMRGD